MSALDSLAHLVGEWTGSSRLWLSPTDTAHASSSTASVTLEAMGKFVTIKYTWAFDNEPQEGLLLLGYEKEHDTVKSVWIDSWHMSDKFMVCQGNTEGGGVISIRGSYPAPPGPDWGWRMVIDPEGGDSFRIVMYNVSPDGEEALAVEAIYARQP